MLKALDRLVTLTLTGVTIREALMEVLVIAGVDYVIAGASLVVGDNEWGDSAIRDPVVSGRPFDALQQAQNFRQKKRPSFDAAEVALANASGAEIEAQLKVDELQGALARPVLPLAPGSEVNLPFPGPDGTTPLSDIMPPHRPAQVLPFPGVPRGQRPGRCP